MEISLIVSLGVGVATFAVVMAVGFCVMRERKRYLAWRLAQGHEWVPVPPGGPVEEGGQCVHCGAWATSEEKLPCWPPRDQTA